MIQHGSVILNNQRWVIRNGSRVSIFSGSLDSGNWDVGSGPIEMKLELYSSYNKVGT